MAKGVDVRKGFMIKGFTIIEPSTILNSPSSSSSFLRKWASNIFLLD